MSNVSDHEHQAYDPDQTPEKSAQEEKKPGEQEQKIGGLVQKEKPSTEVEQGQQPTMEKGTVEPFEDKGESESNVEGRPVERNKAPTRTGLRGTAAMDPKTRKEVARKGGIAVSRNKAHMAEIGRKGGQSVSRNREHMAQIGRKGGAASRGHR